MDSSAFVQIVNAVGFPIAVCYIMGKYLSKLVYDQSKLLTQLKQSVEENTKAVATLYSMIGGERSGLHR